MQFGDWLGQIMGQQFQPTEVQDILDDTSNDEDLIAVIQETSEVVTKAGARKILRDLRELRTATIPVPYVFRNKPRLTALRPMVDIFFSEDADDLQRERWIDRVEYVTEAVLEDRKETDGYDPGFIEEAIKRKGVYSVATHAANSFLNNNWNSYGGSLNSIRTGSPSYNDDSGLIEIHHFRHYSLDMGVPCLYRTVFHMELDEYATHGIDEYKHGQMPFHALRFERDQRPIMSSQGIPSITYTWENEEKAQLDARTDRTSIAMAPPMFVGHSQVTLIKQAYIPHGTIPTLPGREVKFAPIPPYDPGSIEISRSIRQRTSEYFGWFGSDVDPQLKQMRVMELVDRVMGWFK
ncbi:MAG: hypothetical protein M3Q94_19640, partial [Pseudomonadota bacterium]|nr:hypothetical protein [Pseudomonadota bacterium]